MPPQRAPWFRFYSQALHDPKVQGLSGNDFKTWINLLCLANESNPRGSLPPDADVGFALRISSLRASQLLARFHELGLLDADEDLHLMVMHHWEDWQKPSDADLTPGRSEGRAHRPNQAARAAVAPPLRRASAAVAPPLRRASAAVAPPLRRDNAAERREEKRERREEVEEEETRARDPFNIYRLCEQFYGRAIGTLEIQTLKNMEEAYPAECLSHAFQEASDLNKKSIRYVAAICKRHKETGCFVDLRPGTAAAQGNGVAESSGIHIRGYEPPDFVLDP